MITLCAVLVGFEDWVSIEDFGYANEEWLRRFLVLPNGIPSHDTLSNAIGRIDQTAFCAAFGEWVRSGLPALAGQQVVIDGKSLLDSRMGNAMVYIISAFAPPSKNRLWKSIHPGQVK